MPADRRVNVRKPFAQRDCACAALQIGADGDDFADARRRRAFDDCRQVRRVLGVIQMSVCVIKNPHGQLSPLFERRDIESAIDNLQWAIRLLSH